MAFLKTEPISVEHFTIGPARKVFVTEMSDLGWQATKLTAPLYDDACDAGFSMWNPKTNGTTHWFLHKNVMKDGELQRIEFLPTHESLRQCPQLEGWTVVVFND